MYLRLANGCMAAKVEKRSSDFGRRLKIWETSTFAPISAQTFTFLHNMKNLSLVALLAAALFTFACERTDKNLVAQMQADTNTLSGYIAEMSAIDAAANGLMSEVSHAPTAVQATEQYVAVREQAVALSAKLQASLAQLNDAQTQLADLSAGYTSGKINTETARKEYALVSGNYQGIGPLNARLREMVGEIKTALSNLTPVPSVQ